ncbi:hypothetical protein F5X99DRAFT_402081 [Biscogniauxia marginata]|nr:hypothetical protein F5X99DRAFT_402081 [Biscogniauxia marginata]
MRAGLRLQPSQCCHGSQGNRLSALFHWRRSLSSSVPRRSSKTAATASARPQGVKPAIPPPTSSPSLHPSARISQHDYDLLETEDPVESFIPGQAHGRKIPHGWRDEIKDKLNTSRLSQSLYVAHDADAWITSFPPSSLLPSEHVVTCKTGHEQIASFSWVTSTSNVTQRMLYVPGAPAIFREHEMPLEVKRLARPHAFHALYNAGPSNWKPVFQAVEAMRPDFDFDHVDLVTNPPRFAELLAFCSGYNLSGLCQNISLIHDTLFVDGYRFEPRQQTPKNSIGTFGYNFQRRFTEWHPRVENSFSHSRVIKYKVGPLNCVLTAGVDACLEWPLGLSDSRLKVDFPHISKPITGPGAAMLVPLGFDTDLPAAEMKTFQPGPLFANSLKSQTWLNRSEYSILGRYEIHSFGEMARFNEIMIGNMPELWYSWEEENQLALRKLVSLISRLREIVRNTPRKRCFATRQIGPQDSDMHVFTSEGNLPLEEEYFSRFWRKSRLS